MWWPRYEERQEITATASLWFYRNLTKRKINSWKRSNPLMVNPYGRYSRSQHVCQVRGGGVGCVLDWQLQKLGYERQQDEPNYTFAEISNQRPNRGEMLTLRMYSRHTFPRSSQGLCPKGRQPTLAGSCITTTLSVTLFCSFCFTQLENFNQSPIVLPWLRLTPFCSQGLRSPQLSFFWDHEAIQKKL